MAALGQSSVLRTPGLPFVAPVPPPLAVTAPFTAGKRAVETESNCQFHDPHDEVSNQVQTRLAVQQEFAEVDNRDAEAAQWIVKWGTYVVELGDASTFVKRHFSHSRAEFDEAVCSALFGKAPGTLARRLRALLSFKKWSQGRSFGHVPTYASVKAYLIFLRDTKAAPTTGQTFREPLAFLHGFFEIAEGPGTCSDRVLKGIAMQTSSKRTTRRLSPPLPVSFLSSLEEFVAKSELSRDVVLAGTILFCTYARVCFGDVSRLLHEPVIEGEGSCAYMECGVLRHKTAQPVPEVPLPVVATVNGVSGYMWAQRWLDARASFGIVCGTRRGFLPSPSLGGKWGESHMTTKDMGDILRNFVERFAPGSRDVRFMAHSLKATALFWCSKFGLKLGVRRLVGSHKKKGDKSALNYSRDSLSAPLRDLDRVMATMQCISS